MGQFVEGISKFLLGCLLLFQGFLLNAYLEFLHEEKVWWGWTLADIAVLAAWICTLVYARKKFRARQSEEGITGRAHEIEYAYIFWFLYVSLLVPRVGILFHYKASELEEEKILGPNFLKIAVCATPLVFYLLIHSSHNNENMASESMSLPAKAFAGAVDLYDAVDLIEYLLEPPEKAPFEYMTISLTFCCISFFLPTLTLYAMRKKAKPSHRVELATIGLVYEILNMCVINLPFLVIRSILWHNYHASVSVLLMKNVLGVLYAAYGIIEHCAESRQGEKEKEPLNESEDQQYHQADMPV